MEHAAPVMSQVEQVRGAKASSCDLWYLTWSWRELDVPRLHRAISSTSYGRKGMPQVCVIPLTSTTGASESVGPKDLVDSK